MNRTLVFEALLDWNFWGRFKEELKEREKYPEVPESNTCLVIKGVRRSGKSRLAYLLSKKFDDEDVLIINFEDPRLSKIKGKEIFEVIDIYKENIKPSGPELLILDEVQNVSGWEKAVRTLLETKKHKIIVTGSSSKLMSEEYCTVLTGRHIDFELFPLSFREYLMWNNVKLEKLEIYKNRQKVIFLLNQYIKFGGFPEVVKVGSENEKTRLLISYFEDILTKDVTKRYKIREVEKLEELAKNYLSNISCLQSFNKMKRVIKASLDTVERFSRYLEIARLFLFVKKFSSKYKEQTLAPRKVYTIDTGFFNALGFKLSENLGRLMENLVAIELLRRRSYHNPNLEIYYFKAREGYEVDFLIKEGLRIKQLIQVTYANDFDEIDRREIRALLHANELPKEHKPELIIITWDYEDEKELSWFGKKGKIKFVPLWKWLLKLDEK